MNLKNLPINPKKIPYYILLSLLTTGASLILGFLSFGGMFALFPILPLAFAAFALSVAYEGEIYLQNIKGALNKLFKANYLQNHLAKEYLATLFPTNIEEHDCPQFFRDYDSQLRLLHTFSHKHLDKESAAREKQVKKTIEDMEKWFALQLFAKEKSPSAEQSAYTKELRAWLALHGQAEWQDKIATRSIIFRLVQAFSVLAGLFMGLGSTYLIVEAFTVIPFFAAIPFVFWPILVVPMAAIAGAAYGFLTYNTITDLINNDTLRQWIIKLRKDNQEHGFTAHNVFMIATTLLLASLALGLTICTAGTWWTIAANARPLFAWMKNMPNFIMGIINPIITGFSALFFNFQNTAESLEMVYEETSKGNIFQRFTRYLSESFTHLMNTENWLQLINPFRILLKLTVTPLRILLFIGHLISIGLTADRMPGLSQIAAALIAILSEGFEDAHYFIGHSHDEGHSHQCHGDHHHHEHNHEGHHEHGHSHKHQHSKPTTQELLNEHLGKGHGHNHDMDIPTRILQILASPLYLLATTWDYLSSKSGKHPNPLTFSEAWNKQMGIPKEQEVQLSSDTKHPSTAWQIEHANALIARYKTEHFKGLVFGNELAEQKINELSTLQADVQNTRDTNGLASTLEQAKSNPVFNRHRLFVQNSEKTSTQVFIEELADRINIPSANFN